MTTQRLTIIEPIIQQNNRFTLVKFLTSDHDHLSDFYNHVKRQSDINDLYELTKEVTGLTDEQLKGKSRKREIVIGRKLFFSLAYWLSSASTVKIGAHLGMDHATVNNAVSTIEDDYHDWRDHYRFIPIWINNAAEKVGVKTSVLLSKPDRSKVMGRWSGRPVKKV